MSLSGTTTPGQSGPGSDGKKRVLRIPQISSFTGTSQSDCLVLYLEHSLQVGLTPQQRSSWCILESQLTGQLSWLVGLLFNFVNLFLLLRMACNLEGNQIYQCQ